MILVPEHDLEQSKIQLVTALFIQTVFKMATFQKEVQNLLDRNAEYAKSFPGAPTIEQLRPLWKQGTAMMVCMCGFLIVHSQLFTITLEGSIPIPTDEIILTSRFCLVTCVDPRTIPEQFFGPGLRASVYRNAGGRVTDDVVRTLNILRPLANMNLVLVVHHTGM